MGTLSMAASSSGILDLCGKDPMAYDEAKEWEKLRRAAAKHNRQINRRIMKDARRLIRARDGRKTPKQWLWGVAERADWGGLPPRRFWGWLLRRMDRAHGHQLTY